MNRNRIKICGRNTITAPTPAITPSVTSERRIESGKFALIISSSALNPASIASAGTVAQLNTAWNITNRIVASSISPNTGCSATASSACVQRRTGASEMVAAVAIWRARRCSVTMSSPIAWLLGRSRIAASASTIPASNVFRSSSPRRRTATVATTGTPSSAASFCGSSVRPSRSARSNMLSATTTGSPKAISWSAKRRWLSRLDASSTTTSASGSRSPVCVPVTTSRVTRSSGLEGSRL
jgi:hypothetical protein